MCDFCKGKEISIGSVNNVERTAQVVSDRYLKVKDLDREYVYTLDYCPMCGERLDFNAWYRVWVTNITKDEVIEIDDPDDQYRENPLHHIVCDKRFDGYTHIDEQVGFVITEEQLDNIKEHGYCDILCHRDY